MSSILVKEVQGKVVVQDVNGNERVLKAGDVLSLTDKIITGDLSRVVLEHINGTFQIPAATDFALSELGFITEVAALDESASNPTAETLSNVLVTSVEDDLLEDMDATATGKRLENSGSSEAVSLEKLVEGLSSEPAISSVESQLADLREDFLEDFTEQNVLQWDLAAISEQASVKVERFSQASGKVLDLSDVLSGVTNDNLGDFLNLIVGEDGNSAVLQVCATGDCSSAGRGVTQEIALNNLGLSSSEGEEVLRDLIDSGSIVI